MVLELSEIMTASCKAHTVGTLKVSVPSPYAPGRQRQLTDRVGFFLGHKDDPNLFSTCFVFLLGLSRDVCNGQRLDAQALFVPEGLCEQFTVEAGPRPWVSHVSLRIPILQ